MSFLYSIAALSALGGATDGFEFKRKEWESPVLTVKVELYDNMKDLKAAAASKAGHWYGNAKVYAWSTVRADGKCTIHIIDPERVYKPEYIGHEIMHCWAGRFHD